MTSAPAQLAAGRHHKLPVSDGAQLLRLVKSRKGAGSRWPVPCARSYEGHDWEVVRPRVGLPSTLVHVLGCTSTACRVSIPDDDEHTYHFTSVAVEARARQTHDRFHISASQLLMQATFGPTRASIDQLSNQTRTAESDTPGAGASRATQAWVHEQLALPPTLHREYFRRRANPRLDKPSEVGRPRGACEPNARWNRIAIRADDRGETIEFKKVAVPGGGTVAAMHVGGVLRSEVDMKDLRPYSMAAPVSPRPGSTDNCNWCQRGKVEYDTKYGRAFAPLIRVTGVCVGVGGGGGGGGGVCGGV